MKADSANDRVRFGMIGVGGQGSSLLGQAIELHGAECAAASDVYDGRLTLAREIAGDKLPVTRRYQELLDNKEIDCIVAALPDHWHKKIALEVLSAGKDLYLEKPMSSSVEEGYEIV
ncbi:MAG TPA: Gfo/Idh/MocA family oxidoreductase, partial [Terriglobales bacterium]